MTIYDDLVNALICVMRDNATASNKCLACSIYIYIYYIVSTLDDLGGKIEISNTRRAALAISMQAVLIATAECNVWGHACTSD